MSAKRLTILLALMLLAGCQTGGPEPGDAQAELARDWGDSAITIVEQRPEGVDADEPTEATLTLPEAVRRAVAHDPAIQVALAMVREARADVLQTRLLPNPVLAVAFRFAEGGGDPIIDVALAADLLSLLRRTSRISAAENRLRGATAGVLTAVLDALAEVQAGYATVQATEAELAVLRERREIAARLLALGQARFRAGETRSLDVIALQSNLASLDVDIAVVEADRAAARLALAESIGQPSGPTDWQLSPWEPTLPVQGNEAAWVAVALEARPEIRAQAWELAALGNEAAVAGLGFLEGGDVGAHAERDVTWSVGPAATVPLPFFDWGQARRARADAARLAARHELTELRRKAVQDVRSAYTAYAFAADTLRRARESLLPLEERRAAQAQTAYRAGETDVTTLLVAEESLEEARAKVVDLQKRAALARYKLQRATGGARPNVGPATMPTTTRSTS